MKRSFIGGLFSTADHGSSRGIFKESVWHFTLLWYDSKEKDIVQKKHSVRGRTGVSLGFTLMGSNSLIIKLSRHGQMRSVLQDWSQGSIRLEN